MRFELFIAMRYLRAKRRQAVVGVITAFNFPAAVWAWNAMLAVVCGDVVLWKPSELTPLTAVALTGICSAVAAKRGFPGLFTLAVGDGPGIGQLIAQDGRIPLVKLFRHHR